MRRIVLAAVLVLIPLGSAHAQIPTDERGALIALYNSTNGAGWNFRTDWRNVADTDFNAVGTECTWAGVTCSGGHVQQISFLYNNLSGPLPAELGDLENLESLYLPTNSLNGSIPPELGDLSSLKNLTLSSNQLSGGIPATLGSLAALETLALDRNQLSGNIPEELGNLSSLKLLVLRVNQLDGAIPWQLGNLSNLTHLDLHTNQLSDAIPWQLGNLSNLQSLQLKNNQLTGEIPLQLGNLTNLTFIELTDNQLNGPIPTQIGLLPNLEWLDLSNNLLDEGIPPELGSLSTVQTLFLDHNQLSGPIPTELGLLSNLEYFRAESNQLSGPIPVQLKNLSSLRRLHLENNKLSGPIPADLGDLSTLEALSLDHNQLSGSIPAHLGDLSLLGSLSLDHNRLSGEIPAALGQLSNLQYLFLDSNRLHGDIPPEIENTALRTTWGLDLRWNALHTDNTDFAMWLNSKQLDGDWRSTQTIAPEGLMVLVDVDHPMGDHTVWLSWTPVTYLTDPGGYAIYSAPTGTNAWTPRGRFDSKTTTIRPVGGLDSGTTYDLVVHTYTDPHTDNLNLVDSDLGSAVMATTASAGCAKPIIDVGWGDPMTLLVTGTWDSYLWSTAETTVSIDIASPPSQEWYWVTVASGSCVEAAVESPIFGDGFESGDTSGW